MRYVSYKNLGRASYGRLIDNTVVDLGGVPGAPANLVDALRSGNLSTLSAGEILELANLSLLPVVTNPAKIFCVGHNYETHRQETGRAKVGYPSIFTRFADTLIGQGAPILRPKVSTSLDYEGELAIIIGTGGRNISEQRAMSHTAGFTCANDASVRDWQWHTQQFTPGKNFPSTAPLGPSMVTPDEIEDLSSVTVTTRLNGEQVQHASLADLIFPLPMIISYLSTFTSLSAGDVILTGTPGGVGAKREPPLWMKAGDVVEVEISQVGLLRNPVEDEV